MEKIAVILMGNLLRRDDALGITLKERIRGDADLIDGGTKALSLIEVISMYDKVIFVDAVDFGGSPGDIEVFKLENLDNEILFSTHSPDIKKMVELSRMLYERPKEAIIIGIQPHDLSYGMGLSSEIRSKLDVISKKIVEILEVMV